MNSEIQNLKNSELTQVLADGFALLYHKKPNLPVTYLAQYMKNYLRCKEEQKLLTDKISQNIALDKKMVEEQEQRKKQKEKENEKEEAKAKEENDFLETIEKLEYHEDGLDCFCDWIEKQCGFTGVYMGELLHQRKEINLEEEDSEQAHLDIEAPKIIKFTHSSESHKGILLNVTHTQSSLMGRLMTGAAAPQNEGEPEGGGEQGEQVKEKKPNDQVYIPSVVGNTELNFFKYPKLGSFYALAFKIKSYISEKVIDSNITKTQTFQKALEVFEREQEERQTKFRETYDQKAGEGLDQKELEQMEKDFEAENAQFVKPQIQEFQFIERNFAIGVDTLGQDRQISEQEQKKLRSLIEFLKQKWEKAELTILKTDIERHLKLQDKIEGSHQQSFTKLIEQEDKQLPSSEEAEKYKDNEKLFELEIDTLRIQKIKQYLSDQKYEPFLQEIINAKVLKFKQILKYWLIFTGKKKQAINLEGSNLLDIRKAKKLLNKECFLEVINAYLPRGSKPEQSTINYAKWERILRNIQPIDTQLVAASNIYLAFILRFLQITGKVRVADRERRIQVMKEERKLRKQRIKENQAKEKDKEEKREAAKAQCEQKQEQFDNEAWQTQYNEAEQNQPVEVGPEILDQIDRDLENGEQVFPQPEEQPIEAVQEKVE